MVGMNALIDEFGSDLFVLGVPCNNFAMQEPGANDMLLNCYRHVRPGNGFEAKFNISTRQDVNGAEEHELYTFMKARCPATISDRGNKEQMFWTPIDSNDVNWNFEKFLIDTNGKPYKRYHPINYPEDDIASDIRDLLATKKKLQKMEELVPKLPPRKLSDIVKAEVPMPK